MAFLALLFLTAGSARHDIQSTLLFRPLAILCLGVALWGLSRHHLMGFSSPLLFLSAWLFFAVLQLIPLPPSIWMDLPGREIAANVGKLAGHHAQWRPVSLVPSATLNSLFALFIPLAMMLLYCRLTREQRFMLLPFMIALLLFSGLIGVLQLIGPQQGPLYFYRITNNGASVGLFANRNHQAVMLACLFPMLAVFVSMPTRNTQQARFRTIAALIAGGFLFPLIIVTGSRAGMLLSLIAIGVAFLLYRAPKVEASSQRMRGYPITRYLLPIGIMSVMGLATFLMSRASSIDRVIAFDPAKDFRIGLIAPIWDIVGQYFPAGTGLGTFADIYKVHEESERISLTYLNHAHNDLLEIILTGGLAYGVLVAIGIIAWIAGTIRLFGLGSVASRSILFGRMGASLVLILGLASLFDYPLRVPSIVGFFTIAVMWMGGALAELKILRNRPDSDVEQKTG